MQRCKLLSAEQPVAVQSCTIIVSACAYSRMRRTFLILMRKSKRRGSLALTLGMAACGFPANNDTRIADKVRDVCWTAVSVCEAALVYAVTTTTVAVRQFLRVTC